MTGGLATGASRELKKQLDVLTQEVAALKHTVDVNDQLMRTEINATDTGVMEQIARIDDAIGHAYQASSDVDDLELRVSGLEDRLTKAGL